MQPQIVKNTQNNLQSGDNPINIFEKWVYYDYITIVSNILLAVHIWRSTDNISSGLHLRDLRVTLLIIRSELGGPGCRKYNYKYIVVMGSSRSLRYCPLWQNRHSNNNYNRITVIACQNRRKNPSNLLYNQQLQLYERYCSAGWENRFRPHQPDGVTCGLRVLTFESRTAKLTVSTTSWSPVRWQTREAGQGALPETILLWYGGLDQKSQAHHRLGRWRR